MSLDPSRGPVFIAGAALESMLDRRRETSINPENPKARSAGGRNGPDQGKAIFSTGCTMPGEGIYFFRNTFIFLCILIFGELYFK
jgi:hypothetical protein